jgi:hypothetical protein
MQVALEQRLGKGRLDVLMTVGNDAGRPGRWVVVEAKVGAVVDFETLADYLTGIEDRYGPATGLLVAPYEPVGPLPPGWEYQDLEVVADQLGCPGPVAGMSCAVCEEIQYAVAGSVASARVTEWRALTDATRQAALPDDWRLEASGSSVGRPLVWLQSPWLDSRKDSYVQVEIGNRFGLAAASVMLVAAGTEKRQKVVFPDRLWRVLAAGHAFLPALTGGVADTSRRGRGARDPQVADGARRNGVPPAWSLGYDMKGWHGRGRVLRHAHDDYDMLLPAAIEQGMALYDIARQALQA